MPDPDDPGAISDDGYLYGSRMLPREEFAATLLIVASFIAYHDDNHIMGGYRTPDAWAALCKLYGFKPEEFKKVVKNES